MEPTQRARPESAGRDRTRSVAGATQAPSQWERAASNLSERHAPTWLLGANGELGLALNPSPLWGGVVDLEHRALAPSWGTWAARLGLAVHHGQEQTAVGEVAHWLLAGRAAGCPRLWNAKRLTFTPCAELDLGVVSASGSSLNGQRGTAFWASLGVSGRFGLELTPNLELQAHVAVRAALNPYKIWGGGELLYRSRSVSPWAALGVATRW
jgi:hypothetical protein